MPTSRFQAASRAAPGGIIRGAVREEKDRAIIWIAIIGVLFWLVMVRPAPLRKLMKKAGFSWEAVLKDIRKASPKKGKATGKTTLRKPANARPSAPPAGED